jgi:hypothetical protein
MRFCFTTTCSRPSRLYKSRLLLGCVLTGCLLRLESCRIDLGDIGRSCLRLKSWAESWALNQSARACIFLTMWDVSRFISMDRSIPYPNVCLRMQNSLTNVCPRAYNKLINLLIIYNVDFDIRMLKQMVQRYNLQMPELRTHCLMKYYSDYAGRASRNGNGYSSMSLDAACHHFQIDRTNAHRALGDVQVSLLLLRGLASYSNIDAHPFWLSRSIQTAR